MRILFVTPSYIPAYHYGGTVVAVSMLAEHLVLHNHSVTVYTTAANGPDELDVTCGHEYNIDGVNVIYFKRLSGDHTHVSPALWMHLHRHAKDFDVVHLHSWWSFLIIGATLVCKINKIMPLLSPHGMFSEYIINTNNPIKKKIVHWAIGKRLLKYTKLHASTKMEWDECKKILPDWQGEIITNLVKLPDQQYSQPPNKVFTIGFLSRIDPKKGLDFLINALSLVNFPYKLLVAGTGEDKYIQSLKKLAEQLGNSENIEWVGWKGGNDKFDFLAQLDLFTLISHSENFAIVTIESLAVGTPVLISNNVGLFNYVNDTGFGWVTDLNVKNIANHLNAVYTAHQNKLPHERLKISDAVKQHFNSPVIANWYIEMYKKTILPMRILHVTASYKPAYIYGGPINSVGKLCELSKERGADVKVLTTTANGREELAVVDGKEVIVDGVPVIYFKRITKDHTHISPELWKYLFLNVKKYQVVHIHSWWNILCMVSAIICLIRGVKVIVSPRGMLSDYIFFGRHKIQKKWIHQIVGKQTLKRTIFHATAINEYNECSKLIPNWKGFIVPNVLSLPDISIEKTENDVFTLIFLSRIEPKKGLEFVFEAMSLLKEKTKLKIFGTGSELYVKRLKDLAARLNITDRIDWKGWIGNNEKFVEFMEADLCILTSYNENFANVIIESLYMSTPVLITEHVGLASFVTENNLGWVSCLNTENITSSLSEAIRDKNKRCEIEKNGRKIILEQFSEDVLIDQYFKNYASIINNEPKVIAN